MMGFLNKTDSIAYLGITEEQFNYYDAKSLIIYTLKNGQRLYSEDDLDRFKKEVLTQGKQ
jgi:DNA-binding transcriptional MerR regulator